MQQGHELFISTGSAFHNRDRLNRLNALVSARPVAVEDAMGILSDSYSPSALTEIQYSHSGIRAVDQVNSMVFLPDQGKDTRSRWQSSFQLGGIL